MQHVSATVNVTAPRVPISALTHRHAFGSRILNNSDCGQNDHMFHIRKQLHIYTITIWTFAKEKKVIYPGKSRLQSIPQGL
jgi:hypothetical protein